MLIWSFSDCMHPHFYLKDLWHFIKPWSLNAVNIKRSLAQNIFKTLTRSTVTNRSTLLHDFFVSYRYRMISILDFFSKPCN